MAAFITQSAQANVAILNVQELIGKDRPACIRRTDPLVATYRSLMPGLRLRYVENKNAMADALRRGTCSALLAPKSYLQEWQTDPANCGFREREMVVGPLSSGWMTKSTNVCLQRAIDVAMQQFIVDGPLQSFEPRVAVPSNGN